MTTFYQFMLKKIQQKSLKTIVSKMLMYLGNRNTNLISLEEGKEPCTLHMVSLYAITGN